jgi:hypothetical protein
MNENPTNEINPYFKNVLRLCLLPISSYANVIAAKTESLTVAADGDDKKQYASLNGNKFRCMRWVGCPKKHFAS